MIEDGHTSHVSIEVIEVARSNGVYLLCLPSHTTHILQPLDVGVFKSLNVSFYKACKRYMATNPGKVITPDEFVSPIDVMSGFKKCGIYPLNPGEVTDRQLASPAALCPQESSSDSTHSDSSPSCASSTDMKSPQDESHLDTMASDSDKSVAQSCSVSDSADVLSDILVLPKPKPSQKKRAAENSKTACLTDSPVLEQLKRKEKEKVENQSRNRQRERKNINASSLDEEFEALQINSDTDAEILSFVQCPFCGLMYGNDNSL